MRTTQFEAPTKFNFTPTKCTNDTHQPNAPTEDSANNERPDHLNTLLATQCEESEKNRKGKIVLHQVLTATRAPRTGHMGESDEWTGEPSLG